MKKLIAACVAATFTLGSAFAQAPAAPASATPMAEISKPPIKASKKAKKIKKAKKVKKARMIKVKPAS